MGVPGNANALLLRSAAAAGGYQVSRSLRFNSPDSAYLNRTPSVAGNRKTWTWAGWVKRAALGVRQNIFGTGDASFYNGFWVEFFSNDKIRIGDIGASTLDLELITTQVFRDCSAWGHLLVAVDTTQATAANRVSVYWNGSKITAFDTASYPTQNFDSRLNTTAEHSIGRAGSYNGQYFSGYIADPFFIDGQALDPSSFTTSDPTTGQLIPKAYAGSGYGTNGFHLPFSDNSATTATTLGKDTSGNGNNFTPNNFSVTGSSSDITFAAVNAPPSVDYLVVGGGGGGGTTSNDRGAGGGGAGGLLSGTLSLTASTYTVTVGAGGAGAPSYLSAGSDGGLSRFGSLIAFGGGGGASNVQTTGRSGGSGGGGANNNGSGTAPGGSGTAGQGFAGGSANLNTGGTDGGGGGGAGGVGTDGGNNKTTSGVGSGGPGVASSITGTSVTYAKGGRGSGSDTTYMTGTPGTTNRGEGGGGSNGGNSGAAGGSGIVVIRYSSTYADLALISSGLTYSYSNTGGFKTYTFTNSPTPAQAATNAAGNDSLVDTPSSAGTDSGLGGQVTGNYCTLNPLAKGSDVTLVNGNLDCSTSSTAGYSSVLATIGVTSGKWYWEFTAGSGTLRIGLGIATQAHNLSTWLGGDAYGWEYFNNDGSKYTNGSGGAYGASWTTGDVIGVALDADAGTLTFYKNGTTQGQAYSGLTSGPYFPAVADSGTAGILAGSFNFGQRPFAYPVSGFKALCDTNLPSPLIAKGSTVMDVKLYTGNGGTQTISGLGFSPDVVWLKSRSGAFNHALFDTVRSAGYQINPNLTDAETLDTTKLSAFTSDGFTLGSAPGTNGSGSAQVAWCWDAGTSTVTNTQGSINSQVRANASAGFSICTFTQPSSSNSFSWGHGLNVAPQLVFMKPTSSSGNWQVYHASTGAQYLWLNSTNAATGTGWSTVNSSVVTATATLWAGNFATVAYCFAPVAGYSSMGSFVTNGADDNVFVYTGFRPRWIMWKRTDGANSWGMVDTARNTYNVVGNYLLANASDAEANSTLCDILSNGFKMRTSGFSNGQNYIYFAVAESPFQYARAR